MTFRRILGVLKWLPPIWLTTARWLYWGFPMLKGLVGISVSPRLVADRNVFIQHGDTVMVALLYGLALLNRWQPSTGRLSVRWHWLAWGFIFVGIFSALVNQAPLEGALASLASLGRLGLYWAALSMLPWRPLHIKQMATFVRRLSVLNLLLVFGQTLLFIQGSGKVGISGDYGLGIMGFANDAALMSFVWMGGILVARGSSLKKLLGVGIWGMGGLLPAYLTGNVVFIFSLPILWWLNSGKRLSARWFRIIGVIVVAIIIFGLDIWTYTTFLSDTVLSYWNRLQTNTPGFISGFGIITEYFTQHPLNAVLGMGPGLVNSRTVGRLLMVPRIPGLVLAYSNLVGPATPLTVFQMNQSYLVAFAETGILGLLFLSGFWIALVSAATKAVHRLTIPQYPVYVLRCLSAVICLCLLGITTLYWNESPFGYWSLLSLAPIVFVSDAAEKTIQPVLGGRSVMRSKLGQPHGFLSGSIDQELL